MNKTIFVLLDACRYDLGTRNLGYLEHMVDYARGARYRVRGELPSLSRPIYATLFNGLPVHRHGVSGNDMRCRLTTENVFSLCQAHAGITAAAAHCWFSELFCCAPFQRPKDRFRLDARGDIDHGIYYWEGSYPDSHLFADGEYLRRQYDPDFILYHTMGIDWAGHQYGASSAQYEQAILAADASLSQLLPLWLAEEYQVVITSAHGMTAHGNHGGSEDVQRDVPLYLFTPQVKPGRQEDIPISQLNIAPLLCHLLGIQPTPEMLSGLEIPLSQI